MQRTKGFDCVAVRRKLQVILQISFITCMQYCTVQWIKALGVFKHVSCINLLQGWYTTIE